MAEPQDTRPTREAQRKAIVRTALILGAVAIGIYAWAIVSHL